MGHSTSSGRYAGLNEVQNAVNSIINRQNKGRVTSRGRSLARPRDVEEFTNALNRLQVGEGISMIEERGRGENRRVSETWHYKTRNGWEYEQTINGRRVMGGSLPSAEPIAVSILIAARDPDVEIRVKSRR